MFGRSAEEEVHEENQLGSVEDGAVGLQHSEQAILISVGGPMGISCGAITTVKGLCTLMPRKAMMPANVASGLVKSAQWEHTSLLGRHDIGDGERPVLDRDRR